MPTPLRAALLCVLSCAFFAGANALGKAAQTIIPGPDLHPLQITAARFLAALIVLTPILMSKGPSVFRTAIPLRHVQRVLFGVAGVTCVFAAVESLPLADVIAIAWSAPLFALAFAAWFLRERVDGARWIAAAVGFVGVAIMMRLGADALEATALLALAAALFTGAEVVTIRLLAQRDSALTILGLNNLIGAAIACTAAAFVFVVPSWPQAVALFGVGVVMLTGQAIFLKSLTLAEASFIAPFYYATILWATVFGVMVFDETPGWHLAIGGALIIGSGVFVSLRNGSRQSGAKSGAR